MNEHLRVIPPNVICTICRGQEVEEIFDGK